jgi:hypothetical protein
MSFSDIEISNEDGRPVWLYEFRLATKYWRYTSADRDIPWGGDPEDPDIWAAETIFHEQITQGGSSDDLQIPIQPNLDIVPLFRVNSPSQSLWLTIRRRHQGDPDDEAPVAWVGTVSNIKQDSEAQATVFAVSISATFDRNGVWLGWGRNCPLSLYGRGCNNQGSNDPSDHAYPATLATNGGNQITIEEEIVPSEGSFTGGYFEWETLDGFTERRGIEVALDESTFSILGLVGDIEEGTEITLYPGCARNTTNCKLFGSGPRGNLDNYGGFPHLPGKSPFDGTPVF